MKPNKTELIVVLDRSGSMETIKNDMIGALKNLVETQQKEQGECLFSLYQFDNQYEAVFEQKPIGEITSKDLVLVPRGGTALVDAIGRTVITVGQRLSDTPDQDRPETVIIAVITDGEENASREFDAAKVKDLVKHQTDVYSWRFLFLGANMDAVKVGGQYGFGATSSLSYVTTSRGVDCSAKSLNEAVSYMRSNLCAYAFTEEDRVSAMGIGSAVSASTGSAQTKKN